MVMDRKQDPDGEGGTKGRPDEGVGEGDFRKKGAIKINWMTWLIGAKSL